MWFFRVVWSHKQNAAVAVALKAGVKWTSVEIPNFSFTTGASTDSS